jgi:hypothetical protein
MIITDDSAEITIEPRPGVAILTACRDAIQFAIHAENFCTWEIFLSFNGVRVPLYRGDTIQSLHERWLFMVTPKKDPPPKPHPQASPSPAEAPRADI